MCAIHRDMVHSMAEWSERKIERVGWGEGGTEISSHVACSTVCFEQIQFLLLIGSVESFFLLET